MGIQQFVDGGIGRDEGQAIGQFKALLSEGAFVTVGAKAKSGFVDKMQGQAGLDGIAGLATPQTEQIPNTQAQKFRNEQPNTHLIARDFVGQ